MHRSGLRDYLLFLTASTSAPEELALSASEAVRTHNMGREDLALPPPGGCLLLALNGLSNTVNVAVARPCTQTRAKDEREPESIAGSAPAVKSPNSVSVFLSYSGTAKQTCPE